ncbi:invasion associated locus B (IalB) protein [bacterium BMS3Bbin10]|nr:invasion associated locus B (IalB) protein [bacterium BMS3Bbin10]
MVTYKLADRRVDSASVISGLFMGLAIGALFLIAPAQAQQQPAKKAPAATPAKKPAASKKATGSAWVKLCQEQKGEKKQTICLVHHERFHPTTGQPLISAAVRKITGQKQETILIMVPLGRLLRPGLFVKVDKEKAVSLPYSYCTAVGCVAEVPAKPELIASFKKGREITIGTIDVSRKKIGFKIPLTGFSTAYDGPPVDQAIYTKARKDMFAQIRKRQIELAKRAAAAAKKRSATEGAGQPAPKKAP